MADRFHSSYLASGMRPGPFLPSGFGDPAARRARVEAARRRTPPAELRLPIEPGSVVVVTGQQVGLFLGPLYTFYKAATAIATARVLERETGVRAVPLFWLQTEDHDFAEIDHTWLPGPRRVGIASDGTHERAPVACRRLGGDVAQAIDALRESVAGLPHADETVALFAEHYRPGRSLAGAFAGVLGDLFPDLIIFDPRTPVVARLAAPVICRALVEHARIDEALAARGRALREAGFAEQVAPRPGSPLPFHHPDGPAGPRFRPEPGFDVARLVEALASDPMGFSSSALLRPIVQDTLLPTAAYVGGPAEVDYFAQASAIYPIFDMEPPLIVPRARFRLIHPQARRLLAQLGCPPSAVEHPRDTVLQSLAQAQAAGGPNAGWLAELDARLDAFDAGATDPKLKRAVARTRESARRALARLEHRYRTALGTRDQVLAGRIDRLQAWLYPNGAPQERVYSLPWFAAQHGPHALAARVLAAIDPLDPSVRDLDT